MWEIVKGLPPLTTTPDGQQAMCSFGWVLGQKGRCALEIDAISQEVGEVLLALSTQCQLKPMGEAERM